MPNIQCDNCNALFEPQKPKRKVLTGLAYEFYWNCPECNHKYISYYTNQKIRRDIKRQEKRWQKYHEQNNLYDELLIQVDSRNKDKDGLLSDKEMQVVYKLEQSQAAIRRIDAEIRMNDKLIKKDMDALYEKMTKALT